MVEAIVGTIFLHIAAYAFGRYTLPGKPVQEQMAAGLQFIVRQMVCFIIAGLIVLAVWMLCA